MSDRCWSVYIHTTPDGRVYIGATSKLPRIRWNYGHGYRNSSFYEAIQQYGWNNILHEVIATSLTETEAYELEEKLIAEHDSTNPERGYNRATGRGSTGVIISEETRQRLVTSHLGKKNPHTEEWNRKISDANTGRKKPHSGVPWSEETRMKMTGRKPVVQLTKSGEYLATFVTVSEAAKAVSLTVSTISKCCNGRTPTAGGYIWKFKNKLCGGNEND